MNKKAVSGVVTAVLLILLAIGAIAALWVVIASFVSNNSETIGEGVNAVNLEIDSFYLKDGSYYVKVARDTTKGDVEKVRIIIEDSDSSDSFDFPINIREGEIREIDLSTGIFDGIIFDDLKRISVLPVSSSGSIGKLGGELSGPEFTTGIGLAAYYPFDGDLKDYGGNGYDAIQDTVRSAGPLGFVSGKKGDAAKFEGTCIIISGTTRDHKGQSLIIPSEAGMDSGGGVSYAFWFKTDHAGQGGGVQNYCEGENNWNSVLFSRKFTNKYFRILILRNGHTNFGKLYFDQRSLPDHLHILNMLQQINVGQGNQWHLGTLVYDTPNGEIRFYVDDDYENVKSFNVASIPFSESDEFKIGSRYGGWDFFNGQLDEVRIYNRALTAEEIEYLYKNG